MINLSVLLGASGTGRTTFVNTLCGSKVLSSKICDNPEEAHIEDGIKIRPISVGMYSLLCALQLCSTNQTLL
jgi:septin family protein